MSSFDVMWFPPTWWAFYAITLWAALRIAKKKNDPQR